MMRVNEFEGGTGRVMGDGSAGLGHEEEESWRRHKFEVRPGSRDLGGRGRPQEFGGQILWLPSSRTVNIEEYGAQLEKIEEKFYVIQLLDQTITEDDFDVQRGGWIALGKGNNIVMATEVDGETGPQGGIAPASNSPGLANMESWSRISRRMSRDQRYLHANAEPIPDGARQTVDSFLLNEESAAKNLRYRQQEMKKREDGRRRQDGQVQTPTVN
ncbi:hypothetical protein R3P38DRAFT_3574819 [Favolaschia claudopus]|uniref:Uncharacterized protein n=1 Tax=Favolaschia claudopus TaxID=2862362 RepID=A0AAW0AKD2_9AGAR